MYLRRCRLLSSANGRQEVNLAPLGDLLHQPQGADRAIDGHRQPRPKLVAGTQPVADAREAALQLAHDLSDRLAPNFNLIDAICQIA